MIDLSGAGHGDDGSGGFAGGGEAGMGVEVLEGVGVRVRVVEFGARSSEARVGLRQGFRARELGGERCGGHRHFSDSVESELSGFGFSGLAVVCYE